MLDKIHQQKKKKTYEKACLSLYTIFVYIPVPTPLSSSVLSGCQFPESPWLYSFWHQLHAACSELDTIQTRCSAPQSKWAFTTHSIWQWFKAQCQMTKLFLSHNYVSPPISLNRPLLPTPYKLKTFRLFSLFSLFFILFFLFLFFVSMTSMECWTLHIEDSCRHIMK